MVTVLFPAALPLNTALGLKALRATFSKLLGADPAIPRAPEPPVNNSVVVPIMGVFCIKPFRHGVVLP